MLRHKGRRWIWAGAIACVMGVCAPPTGRTAETSEPPAAAATTNQVTDSKNIWLNLAAQSIQQLNEQQQALMRAIEQTRTETEASSQKTTEAMNARLKLLEQALADQRAQALAAMQSSHQLTVIVVGLVAGIGFGGMMLFAVLFVRALNRRANLAGASTLPVPYGHGFGVPVGPVEQATGSLHGQIDRVQERMNQLEAMADAPPPAAPGEPATPEQAPSAHAPLEREARVGLLVGKGQALLNLEKPAEALVCFDEALGIDPHHVDALVKKGTALERLGRLDDAIVNYDRAIAQDDSFTMAYLCKGGVFNRLERYGEALQCYEQALRTHEKSRTA